MGQQLLVSEAPGPLGQGLRVASRPAVVLVSSLPVPWGLSGTGVLSLGFYLEKQRELMAVLMRDEGSERDSQTGGRVCLHRSAIPRPAA